MEFPRAPGRHCMLIARTASTLHRAPVGQGPSGPDWLAISFGFWSGRALATGTAWAGLCLIHHHHRAHGRKSSVDIIVRVSRRPQNGRQRRPVANNGRQRRPVHHNHNSNIKVNPTSAFLGITHQAQHHHIGIVPVSGALCRLSLHQKELHRVRELRRVTRVRLQKRGC